MTVGVTVDYSRVKSMEQLKIQCQKECLGIIIGFRVLGHLGSHDRWSDYGFL
jgi:hypothetical protein